MFGEEQQIRGEEKRISSGGVKGESRGRRWMEKGRCSCLDEGRSEMQRRCWALTGVKEEESGVGEQRFMCGEGAGGNSQAYYRWDSPGRAGPGVFQAFPAYFTKQHAAMHKAPPST